MMQKLLLVIKFIHSGSKSTSSFFVKVDICYSIITIVSYIITNKENHASSHGSLKAFFTFLRSQERSQNERLDPNKVTCEA